MHEEGYLEERSRKGGERGGRGGPGRAPPGQSKRQLLIEVAVIQRAVPLHRHSVPAHHALHSPSGQCRSSSDCACHQEELVNVQNMKYSLVFVYGAAITFSVILRSS